MRIIEAARTRDGEEPVEEFMERLEDSKKRSEIERFADVAIVFEEYGSRGSLRIPRELNQLKDELWEIKAGDVRFPFYQVTDGDHPAIVARLTGAFIKGTRRTPRREIDRALWVMKEDKQA
jgi:hypothetical protein